MYDMYIYIYIYIRTLYMYTHACMYKCINIYTYDVYMYMSTYLPVFSNMHVHVTDFRWSQQERTLQTLLMSARSRLIAGSSRPVLASSPVSFRPPVEVREQPSNEV